jgi:ABC-2 type transport system permease protein
MTLLRLEVARLMRTNRWMILAGTFGLFGVLGPVTARYIGEIVARFGGEIEVVLPDPEPIDGMAQFISNASQIGVLAVVVVGAAALAMDARPEVASFYRTRVPGSWSLIRPRFVVNLAASVGAMAFGTALAVVGTEALIGSLDITGIVVGTVLASVYLAFILALVALMATITRSATTTVFAALAGALLLPIVGLVGTIKPWLPSELVVAPLVLATGGRISDFGPSFAVSAAATALFLVLATRRAAAREL